MRQPIKQSLPPRLVGSAELMDEKQDLSREFNALEMGNAESTVVTGTKGKIVGKFLDITQMV